MPSKHQTVYFNTYNHRSNSSFLFPPWCLGASQWISGLVRADWILSYHTPAFSIFSKHCSDPRSPVALFKQGNIFLQLFWWEWALPQGSKTSFHSNLPPSAALQCNISSTPSGEVWTQTNTPELLSLLLPKDNGQTSSPEPGHPPSPHLQCVWFHGALPPAESSPSCWYTAKPTYTQQVLSFPLGDRASQ